MERGPAVVARRIPGVSSILEVCHSCVNRSLIYYGKNAARDAARVGTDPDIIP